MIKHQLSRRPQLIKLGLILLIAAVVGSILFLVNQIRYSQELRQQASTSPAVELSLQPSDSNINAGGTFTVDILLNTKTNAISGLDLAVQITGISRDQLSIDTIAQTGLSEVSKSITANSSGFLAKLVQFASLSSSNGFNSNSNAVKIGQIKITTSSAKTVGVTILTNQSQVVRYGGEVLAINAPAAQSYSISIKTNNIDPNRSPDVKKSCNENCATDTECKSEFVCYQGRCRKDSDKNDDRCGDKPDQGIHRGCNEYCADSQECNSEYICYYNRCRNPKNITNESCSQPPSPSPRPRSTSTSSSSNTTPGKGGTAASPSPTPSPSPLVTPSVSASTSPSLSPSPSFSPYSFSPRPSSSPRVSPSIVPLPDELKPENYNKPKSNLGRNLLIIFGGLGIIGLIGFGIYYWQKTAP